MSIYTTYWAQQADVQHLSATKQPIQLGALVKLSPEYHCDIERHVKASLVGYQYRVIGLTAVPSSFRERLGIERERSANLEINAGKERWYAAVQLAAVLTNDDGILARIDKSPCETFLERYLRCSVPAGILHVIEAGTGSMPVGDVDYSISPYEHLFPKYQAVDQTYEEWSNRPTACLAMFLLSDSKVRDLLKRSVTSKGQLTSAKLQQLTRSERWIDTAVPAEAYFTDPFPEFHPYLQAVNFDEIAAEITALHKAGEL